MKPRNNPCANYDYKKTKEYQLHLRAMAHLDAMSPEEKLQTFIRVGIFNQHGELTQRYGGSAPNEDDLEETEDEG